MNSLTSSSNIQHSNIFDTLHDHENFAINWKKIFSELVECAEHLVLACSKNPWFVTKLINAEYDLLIGDDVSGRPITLMIKNIIDYYRKSKCIKWWIDNIFIDNPKYLSKNKNYTKIKNRIRSEKNSILISTEHISSWRAVVDIVDVLELSDKKYDIFTQHISHDLVWAFRKDLLYYYWESVGFWATPLIEKHPNMQKHIWILSDRISENFKNPWFAIIKPKNFINKIKEILNMQKPVNKLLYRHQIKLLSQYIIDHYLKN